ncbi:hypothetical protein QUF58_10125 [Anaerolineales bacterium HSG24]|nr:hypothetical protein [Anaerolineales bacterium HSG24]
MSTIHNCLNCQRSENEGPLVSIRYRQQIGWICTQCLPILIHKTDQLTDKLMKLTQSEPSNTASEE